MSSDDTAEIGAGHYSTEELHDVLASENRRMVLQFFRERGDEVATLDELAGHVTARGGGVDDPDRAKTVLHHAALPKLANVGAIEYDPRTGTSRYRGHTRLEALLPEASANYR